MKLLSNKKIISIILFLFGAAMMVACGGGGGGGGGGESTATPVVGAPTLNSVALLSPSKDDVLKSTSYSFQVYCVFTDKEGDVGGGKVYFQYGATTLTGDIPSTSQTYGDFTLFVVPSITTDTENTKIVYVWIKDKAGNESNRLPITLTQR